MTDTAEIRSEPGNEDTPGVTDSVTLLIPTFNDWPALGKLLHQLDRELAELDVPVRVLVVDDGSTISWEPRPTSETLTSFASVQVLALRRNLGHQRAIAIGLAYLYAETDTGAVVVMDGDGEDRPSDVPRLIERLRASDRPTAVFAERTRRSESLTFRFFYTVYLAIHWLLLGRAARIGNFSALSRPVLTRLSVVSEMWNHYPAAVVRSRVPIATVPTERGTRLDGRSTMNFIGLVVHGLSAIAVSGDIVWVRILTGASLLIVVGILISIVAIAIRFFTDYAIPGWATNVVGLAALLCLQALAFAFVLSVTILNSRIQLGFIPIRDYRYFVDSVSDVAPRA
jgi:glycosyltransferase involved in cell wall biosynthesis